jgi:DNA-directed RNA polymerase specialized sigma24 family protein
MAGACPHPAIEVTQATLPALLGVTTRLRALRQCQQVARASDRSRVGMHDEELLRRFVACRRDGDAQGAFRWWSDLVEANFDRVRALVDLRATRYGLSASERDDAVSLALLKLWRNMIRTFEGATMGEWVNATRRLVDFACAQVQRDAARRGERQSSLDPAPGEDDDDLGASGWRLAAIAHQEHRRETERNEASAFVGWAVPRLKNERRRLVVERTLDGVPAEDIADELDVSVENLYALRSRGLKDLARLRREYER